MHSARQRSERSRPLVVFDFDGTLADTWRDIASALNRTLDEAGLAPVQGPDVRFWIGDGVKPLLRKAIPELRDDAGLEELYARFSEHYRACLLDTTRAYPGIAACLDALDDALLVVASNKPYQFLDRIVRGLGFAPRFRLVLGGDSLAVRKPDPAVITAISRRLEQPTREVWMVGDSAVDVNTGRAAGARTIGCTWGLRGRDELVRAGADFLIESPAEIPDLVLGGRVSSERRTR